MGYFKPVGGQLLIEATTTPSSPTQLNGPSGTLIAEPISAFRVMIYDAATEVHLAYGPTAAIVTAIVGTGSGPSAGVQTAGVMTFGGCAGTVGAGSLDYIVLPSNSFLSVWTATTTADVYITPGQETTH